MRIRKNAKPISLKYKEVTMKRLYRIKNKGKIGGVCAGLGEYLDVDPNIIRIIMLLLMFSGPGIILYLLMMIALPEKEASNPPISETSTEEPYEEEPVIDVPASDHSTSADANLWIGFGLIIIGGLFLLRNFGFNWFNWIYYRTIWPILLIAAGIYILFRKNKS